MPKLINRGHYYELQEDNNGQLFASILNGLASGLTNVMQMRQQKKLQDQKLQETRLDMQAKINAMDPDIQRNLLQNSPELRRFLIDPNQLKQDPEQRKALDSGAITPMMPKIRKRNLLETATLLERQEGARKEGALADKATSEAALQADITAQRRGLMTSDNPYEQILGLTGEVMTSDKLEAMMTGINEPRAAFDKYMSNVPGTMQFKTQAQQKAEAQLLSEINPQTPEEMQGVKDMSMYIAGLGPMPRKMPKNLQAKAQDIDKWRVRVQEQGNQITAARLTMETNAKIHALGDTLSVRLKGTGREGSAFSIAEGMIRGGKFPTDLPPDVMALADQEHKLVTINMDKLKYEQQLQQSPKLQMLLDMAGKSATAGDDKGAQQYIKMAEVERRKVFGEDKPDPNERKRFWNTVLTLMPAVVSPAGVGISNQLAGTSLEQKMAMMKWAGVTAGEIAEVASTLPGRFQDLAAKGMVTSPGQARITPNSESPVDEAKFQAWYKEQAKKTGINENPDDPAHKYDYRAAYKAGVGPGKDGHWPSQFKALDHPNRFVDGIDTITGAPAPKQLPTAPSTSSGAGGRLTQDQVQAMENMLRDIDKMSFDNMTYEKRDQLNTLLTMIEEVKAGKRPFMDLITPDR
jgi:hypothetical protein